MRFDLKLVARKVNLEYGRKADAEAADFGNTPREITAQ